MRRPRGPGGRFLTQAEIAAMGGIEAFMNPADASSLVNPNHVNNPHPASPSNVITAGGSTVEGGAAVIVRGKKRKVSSSDDMGGTEDDVQRGLGGSGGYAESVPHATADQPDAINDHATYGYNDEGVEGEIDAGNTDLPNPDDNNGNDEDVEEDEYVDIYVDDDQAALVTTGEAPSASTHPLGGVGLTQALGVDEDEDENEYSGTRKGGEIDEMEGLGEKEELGEGEGEGRRQRMEGEGSYGEDDIGLDSHGGVDVGAAVEAVHAHHTGEGKGPSIITPATELVLPA